MKIVTLDAVSAEQASQICQILYGWTPDCVTEVDSGDESTRAWKCFESMQDAKIWEDQT